MDKCPCGNAATQDGLCDSCVVIIDAPVHAGHFSTLGGAWWCDTCKSPYCDLL